MFRVSARLAFPFLLLLVSPVWADFSALSSNGFTYCYFDSANLDGDNCVDSELVSGGDCFEECHVPGSYGAVSGRLPWEINGEGQTIDGDAVYWTYGIIHGDRTSDTIFTVSGACAYADEEWAGPPEVALFRFDGDPSVFDGTSAVSVSEFVDLGLIDAADVLFVHDCGAGGQFDNEVDVTGIPDQELVVFAGAHVSPGFLLDLPVPAVSPVGTAVLALLLFGTGVAALRRRAVQRRD